MVYDWTICYHRSVHLILWPIQADLGYNILHNLGNDISKEFEDIKITLNVHAKQKTVSSFQSLINKRRNQWNSFKLLEWLNKSKHDKGTKILAIFDVDAYSTGFDFVFGEAFYQGRVAAVYLPRLRQEFYGLGPNQSLFYERLLKECIHELGHVFGFGHCNNSQCVMHFSTSLFDIDTKASSFCHACSKKNLDSILLDN
jgi:archaemetzincin